MGTGKYAGYRDSEGYLHDENFKNINQAAGGVTQVGNVAVPARITMVPAQGAADACEITISVLDGAGALIAKPHVLDVWLSDDVDGEGLTATTASGAVAAKASSGTDLVAMVAKKALRVQTLKTGVYILSITDTAKTLFKVCASLASLGGRAFVGATLVAGNYG